MNNYMKRNFFLMALCAWLLVSCGSAPSSSSTNNASSSTSKTVNGETQAERDRRQRIYMEFLRQEGYSPSIDEDKDIMFKREGYTYYILIGKTDPTYLSLSIPQIVSINSDTVRKTAANAVSYANRSTKVAKAWITSNNNYVSVATEMYLENPNDFGVLVNRMISATATAMENVKKQMN